VPQSEVLRKDPGQKPLNEPGTGHQNRTTDLCITSAPDSKSQEWTPASAFSKALPFLGFMPTVVCYLRLLLTCERDVKCKWHYEGAAGLFRSYTVHHLSNHRLTDGRWRGNVEAGGPRSRPSRKHTFSALVCQAAKWSGKIREVGFDQEMFRGLKTGGR